MTDCFFNVYSEILTKSKIVSVSKRLWKILCLSWREKMMTERLLPNKPMMPIIRMKTPSTHQQNASTSMTLCNINNTNNQAAAGRFSRPQRLKCQLLFLLIVFCWSNDHTWFVLDRFFMVFLKLILALDISNLVFLFNHHRHFVVGYMHQHLLTLYSLLVCCQYFVP